MLGFYLLSKVIQLILSRLRTTVFALYVSDHSALRNLLQHERP